jgi:hypothetical protein
VSAIVFHVIYCRGCRKAWIDPEWKVGTVSVSMVIDARGCACACTDGDPLYEAWVIDPDPGDVPPGAWER